MTDPRLVGRSCGPNDEIDEVLATEEEVCDALVVVLRKGTLRAKGVGRILHVELIVGYCWVAEVELGLAEVLAGPLGTL